MKKILCLSLTIIMIFSLTSCNEKRIPVEKTKNNFNKYVEEIEKCKQQNNIIFDTYEDNFKDNSGGINFTFAEDDNISVSFQLYNDRFNPFGENYENGVEKYYIWYQREFNYIDNILNTENSAFKILPVILSNITSQNVTENETKQHFSELKETIQIPDCDYTKSEDNFIEESSNFKNVRIRYSLSYSNINNKLYEVISFGGEGYNNYTVV